MLSKNHYTRYSRFAQAVCFGACLMVLPGIAAEPVTLCDFQSRSGWTSRIVRADCVDIGDGTNRLRLFPGLRRTEFNGVAVWLHAPAEPDDTTVLTLDRTDVEGVLLPILQAPPLAPRRMRVMLDPGHGGEDGGAAAANLNLLEKDIVLDLAIRLGERLEAANMTVGFTRTDDTFLTLSERTATAAVWRADAFVSLHANSAANTQAAGRETFVLPVAGYEPTAGESRLSTSLRTGNAHDVMNNLLGFCIHRQLPGRLHAADRGLRRARFQILRQAPCPAALVEIGFLSNPREAKLLASGWYRDRMARAIADGLIDFSRYLAASPTNGVPAQLAARQKFQDGAQPNLAVTTKELTLVENTTKTHRLPQRVGATNRLSNL